MTTYEIHIYMTQAEVKDLSSKNYSLCFAKAIADSSAGGDGPKSVSDVVTASYEPGAWGSSDTLFKWTDKYSIAARTEPFKQGDVIKETGTDLHEVKFKDLLVVQDWANVKITKDSKVLKDGEFGYNPANPKYPGVSILYVQAEPKGVNGNPCYTSANAIAGGADNVEHLAPVASADVFFGYKAQTGSVKVQTTLYPAKLKFEDGKNKATLKLNRSAGNFDIEYSEL